MGERGPTPKRADKRLGHTSKAQRDEVVKADGAAEVEIPRAKATWHPVAKRWYSSLERSGQSKFYEESDWAAAYLLAESMSRELKPQVVGTTESGRVIRAELPPKAASLMAWLKGMTALMVTEGDRRRARLELDRPSGEGEASADVSWIDDARARLGTAG